ncbi:MAG: YdbL family protein [Verrucomicrobiota bacterium]|nr:YdbL family protein [Verrucomicrobiota bacterium]
MKRSMISLIFGAALAFSFAGTMSAQPSPDRAELHRRFVQRLPALDALKARGVIGENNQGFVELRRQAGPEAGRLIAAENADRSLVYTRIAQRNGSTPEQVGRTRAKKIAEIAKSGVWLQAADGGWYKK